MQRPDGVPREQSERGARQVATGARALLSLAIGGFAADDKGSVLTEI